MNEAQQIMTAIIERTDTQKILDAMPGLIGAIDRALRDTVGHDGKPGSPVGFVLFAFRDGTALHATNFDDPSKVIDVVKEMAAAWDENPPAAQSGGAGSATH